MKVFCRACGKRLPKSKDRIISCACGEVYDLDQKGSSFTLKTKAKGVETGLTATEIRTRIGKRFIKGSDLLAVGEGPWVPVHESLFADLLPKKQFIRSFLTPAKGWFLLFFLSFMVNVLLVTLLYWQKIRIDELIAQLAGK